MKTSTPSLADKTASARTSPAIVAQEAVRRLPRWVLLGLCFVYILAGFVGREPWKSADMAAFGVMRDIALGYSPWFTPSIAGLPAEAPALLPYWLGALAIALSPAWLPIDFAARLPFVFLLGLTMVATWYGIYHLARRPDAQPVPFAFGGEARSIDYARCLADGGLLALVAMLGLAQLAHETTPTVVQLACAALLFFSAAASAHRFWLPVLSASLSSAGLALSGAPAYGLALVCAVAIAIAIQSEKRTRIWAIFFVVSGLLSTGLAIFLGQWQAHWGVWPTTLVEWRNLARLFIWFVWPAWPLALIAIWKWRIWWRSLHIALPTLLVFVITIVCLIRPTADRVLILAMPPLACLAAFALPTLQRSISALVDWFTLLFFSLCGLTIWIVWIAMQTGTPPRIAANVQRLVPGFESSFSFAIFFIAACATVAWVFLVKWRVGRHRAALWKSLVLPAGGAILSWLLLMTLWMPLLNFARSYAPLTRQVTQYLVQPDCVQMLGLSHGQMAAFSYHAGLKLQTVSLDARCPWLIVDADAIQQMPTMVTMNQWTLRATLRRPSDDNEDVLLYQRNAR